MGVMKKEAVGVRTGGFMQVRRGTRPLHVETLLRRKGHDSAANVFEPDAPTATDKTFEQSLAATAGDEFQPAEQGPEKEAELRRDTVDEKSTPVSPELIESVKIRRAGERDGKQVFLVDGGKIRDKIDVDFALGGNSARYSYVPEGELWVENTGSKKDVANTTIHEDREEGLMRRGQTYDQAHGTASREEEGRRKEAQHRERIEVFALKDGKVIGGRYPDESFGVYGGGIDPEESAYKAARREFAEEAGYKLRKLRHAKEVPFASPWAVGEQKGLAFPEKVRQRIEQFPSGHRTTYLVGEVGRETPVSDTPTQLRDIRPYDISEAIKFQTGALAKATGDDARRIRSRLGVLHELQQLNMQKRAAAKTLPILEEVVRRVPPSLRGGLFPRLPFEGVWRRKTLSDIAGKEGLPKAIRTYRMMLKHVGSQSKEMPLAERLKAYKRFKSTGELPRISRLGTVTSDFGARPLKGNELVTLHSYGPEEGLRAALKQPASALEPVYVPGRSTPQKRGLFFWEGEPGTTKQVFTSSPRGLGDEGTPAVLTLKIPRSRVLETGKHKELHPLGERIVPSEDLLRYAQGATVKKLGAAAAAYTGKGEFAPGIPIGRVVKKIPSVKEKGPNAEWTASLSLHPAAKRGDHFDLRLVDPQGKAHSWAINKMPVPGGSTYAAQQPTHSGAYAKRTEPFTIPLNVYGGTRPGAQVEPKYVQPVEIISANDKRVHLLRHQGQETEELVLRRVAKAGDRTPIWALHNATKTRSTQEGQRLPDSKPKYQDVPIGSVDLNNDQQLMTAKIDGAHTIVDFSKADRMVRTYSYRPTQRQSGVIEHTFKFPDFQNLKTPKSLKGTIIRAETWASDQSGKAIPASEIGGLLNSNVNRSRQLQQEQGITLRRTGIDVVKFKGKDMTNAPFADKLKVLEQVYKATGGAIELPLAARTPEEKAKLLGAVKAGKLPETKEGVVLHDLGSNVLMKAKVRPDTDVYVREVFTKPRTEAKGQAAGFKYSLEPTGPIVGRVGTGLSTSLRKEMLENPDQFVGRVAKVQSGGQHISRSGKAGALIGSPAFKEWHIDKTPPELLKSAESPGRWHGISEAMRDAGEEADPEKLIDRLTAVTRGGRALKPVLESHQVRPYVSRLRRAYHRIMKDKSSA